MNIKNKYINHILKYNKIHMLTGFNTQKEVEENLIINSTHSFKDIDIKNKSILDVGTGCGIPGIPLKINEDSIKLTLLEVMQKRVKFLREVKEYIEFDLITGRAEEQWVNHHEKFDIVTMRAFAHSSICLEIAAQYLKVEGILVLIKGPNVDEELKITNKTAKILNFELSQNYKLEDSSIKTKIIIYKKTKKTNKKYPRKFKLIKEKMLGEK